MRRNNIMLIVQVVLMYVAQIPFYISLILLRIPNIDSVVDRFVPILILFSFLLTILILPYCLVCAMMALLSLIRGSSNPGKTTMIIKLLLIPWYVMNFLLCDLLLVGFLNPWLFIVAPVALIFLVVITYLIMLSTSIFDIAYGINKNIKRKIKVDTLLIFTYIFLFCFCLDVIGSIIFYFKTKEKDVDSISN